ncbi:MAG: GxxExxY protein [Chloroflexi bacterium]|nr:MAG: GxxExxY protein [Chloroflexota bacterium]
MAEENDPRTYAIIGAAMEVHRRIGPGFLEAVYHEALEIELSARNVPFDSKARIDIRYRDRVLTSFFQADFICFREVIVEIKAIKDITTVEEAQLFNYLRVSKLSVGLLLNFGTPSLQKKRFAMTHYLPPGLSA